MRTSAASRSSNAQSRGFVLVVVVAALAGCSGDANPVRDAAVAIGAGPKITPAPDFVAQTRPARLDYIPIGTAGAGRPTPARTAAEVKAAEAELEAVRTANEAAAQAARQGQPTSPPAPAKPKRPKPARTP
jgi:hypothetical protein